MLHLIAVLVSEHLDDVPTLTHRLLRANFNRDSAKTKLLKRSAMATQKQLLHFGLIATKLSTYKKVRLN